MGTIHKLKPEVIEFILKIRKDKSTLGCRKIASLVYQKFKVDVSKSSINAITKNSGLNMPVGRRRKKSRSPAVGIPPIKEVIKTAADSIIELSSPKEELLSPPQIERPVEEAPKEEPAPAEPTPQEPPKEEPPVEKIPETPAEEPPKEKAPAQPKPKPEEPVLPEAEKKVSPEPPKEEVVPRPAPEEAPAEAQRPQPAVPQEVTTQEALPAEATTSGVVLFKAADYLTGGIFAVSNLIKERFKLDFDYIARNEFLLYSAFFSISLDNLNQPFEDNSGIWPLVNSRFKNEEIDLYICQLHDAISLNPQIAKAITQSFQEARGIKVQLSNNDVFYLGPQMHTVYSDAEQIPYDFSLPIFGAREKLKEQLKEGGAVCLLTAPGYDSVPKEFFDFMLALENKDQGLSSFTLYGNKLEDLGKIPAQEKKQYNFLLALWPWQFQGERKIKLLGEFQSAALSFPEREIFVAEAEVSLTQRITGQSVTLRGSAVKFTPQEKIALIILSNFSKEQKKPEELARIYFSSWPDPLLSFEAFSRSRELFTYSADSDRLFKLEHLSATTEIKDLFSYYLKSLDSYLRWHILPPGYEDKEFSWVKSNLYDLKVMLKSKGDCLECVFEPPAGYPCLKDLQYACQHLNQSNIEFFGGKKVLFSAK